MHLCLASDFSFRSSMWAIWVWIILHAHSSKIFLYKTDIALTLLLRKKRFYQEVSDVRIYWTDIIKDNNSITDVFIKLCLHSRNVWSSWKLILILSSSRYGLLWWPDHIGNMRTINFKNKVTIPVDQTFRATSHGHFLFYLAPCCCGLVFLPLSFRFCIRLVVALPLFSVLSFFILGSTCLYMPLWPAGLWGLFWAVAFLATTYLTSGFLPTDCALSGLVINSILFCWLFIIKDQCKQVRFSTNNRGLHHLFSGRCLWDLRAYFRLIFCAPLKKNSRHKNSIFHKLKGKNQTQGKNSNFRHFLSKEYGKMNTSPYIFSQIISKMIILW